MVDVNTTVFNKQLEELESLADSTGLYEDQQDDDEEEVQAEPSMEWRRAALEESASRVKRAKGRPVDPNKVYEIGTLLFEPAEGKFGRVKRSVQGYLSIQFLRGGEREYGRRPDVESYLRENHRGKTASELATQIGLTETEIQGHLNRLGLVRVDTIPGMEGQQDEERKEKSKGKSKSSSRDVIPHLEEEPARRGRASEDIEQLSYPLPARGKDIKSQIPTKAGASKAPNGKTHPAATKAPTKTGKTQVPGKTQAPGAGKTMSMAEANAFIKKHYTSMSNRDLAKKTGLSEHTVRRKLGEWGLRRK